LMTLGDQIIFIIHPKRIQMHAVIQVNRGRRKSVDKRNGIQF